MIFSDHFETAPFFVLRKQLWFPDQNTASVAGRGESRRGPPVAEISSAAFSCETSDLSGGTVATIEHAEQEFCIVDGFRFV